jgi:hypothetical protein
MFQLREYDLCECANGLGLDEVTLAELDSKRLLNCANQFGAVFAKQSEPLNFVAFEEHVPDYRVEWFAFSLSW